MAIKINNFDAWVDASKVIYDDMGTCEVGELALSATRAFMLRTHDVDDKLQLARLREVVAPPAPAKPLAYPAPDYVEYCLAKTGNKISAIKYYRRRCRETFPEWKDMSVLDAKTAIDAIVI